jgi:Na+/H+-dicarboxylate symporter
MSHHGTDIETSRKERIPFFVFILIALLIGALFGHLWHEKMISVPFEPDSLKWVSDVVLRMLRLLATPLIFSAVLASILTANITGKKAGKLMWLLMSNTVVAIGIGLLIANTMKPGQHLVISKRETAPNKEPYNIWSHLLESIPSDFISPFQKNDIISIIIIAVSLGFAMRILKQTHNEKITRPIEAFETALNAVFQISITILKWVFKLVPLAVFAVVTRVVADKGVESLLAMGYWIGSVVVALLLMAVFYIIRMYLAARISPLKFLSGAKDAFLMAFGTASSAATLPITYRCATENLKVKHENANMGIMVGGTFNHDGTALYEAMAALFIAQGLGMVLGPQQQVIIVLMAIIASVGAAGIPEAGLVTMIAVFKAVNLPTEYIPFLLTVDWFLDRCRTTINVMGDMASTCILNSKD